MTGQTGRRARARLALLAAAVRLSALESRCGFQDLVGRLRAPGPTPPDLAAARLYLRLVTRCATWLPPWGMGPCLKRSLLLLDLWSRCGLSPRLHLGLRRTEEGDTQAHAWVSAPVPGSRPLRSDPLDYGEAFLV